MFIEILNEPAFQTAASWNTVMYSLLASARVGAPLHTLIASANLRITANDWNSITALTSIMPVAGDNNIVYNFHYYEPSIFTHQGATWGWDVYQHISNLTYPSSPAAVAGVASGISDPTIRGYVTYYGSQYWNRTFLYNKLKPVATWAKLHNVIVTCNEFGVYRLVSPPAGRNAYIRDLRSVLEELDIGWALWELDKGFGLFQSGLTTSVLSSGKGIDVEMADALFSSTCLDPKSPEAIASFANLRSVSCPVKVKRARRVFTHYLPWFNVSSIERNGWCEAGSPFCTNTSFTQYTVPPLIGEYDQVFVLY
jgi:hypothetical protein